MYMKLIVNNQTNYNFDVNELDYKPVIDLVWSQLHLDYNHIINSLYDLVSCYSSQEQYNFLNNITKREDLLDMCIYGLILNKAHNEDFFKLNLQNLINKNILRIYPYINTNIFSVNSSKLSMYLPITLINFIINKIGVYFRIWFLKECKNRLKMLSIKQQHKCQIINWE